jgi:hypothetical protein
MKRTRQDRVWVVNQSEPGGLFVDAVILGEWFVAKNAPAWYTLSHASGLAVRERLSAVQAAHLLRRLQAAPPCPLSAGLMRHQFRGGRLDYEDQKPYAQWKRKVKRILDTVPVPKEQR